MRGAGLIAASVLATSPAWGQDGEPSGMGWALFPPSTGGTTFYDPNAMSPEEVKNFRNANCQHLARYAEEQMAKVISGFDMDVSITLKGNSENTKGVSCTMTSKRVSEYSFSGETE